METFEILEEDLLDKSYIDYLLMKKNNTLVENVEALYAFENKKIAIAEFKRTDLDDSNSPDDRFHWLKHDKINDEVMRLNFVSTSNLNGKEERTFSKEKLVFNSDEAFFSDSLTVDEKLLSTEIASIDFNSKNRFKSYFNDLMS